MLLVNALPKLTVFPVMSVTLTAYPSPRSNTNPGLIPVVLLTTMLVSPMDAFVVQVVDAAEPPGPVTEVIWEPVVTPVPVSGEPSGGGEPLNPIMSTPAGVIKLVVIVPLDPAEKMLNAGAPMLEPV